MQERYATIHQMILPMRARLLICAPFAAAMMRAPDNVWHTENHVAHHVITMLRASAPRAMPCCYARTARSMSMLRDATCFLPPAASLPRVFLSAAMPV